MMFASKTPRDLNRDPKPLVCGWGVTRMDRHPAGTGGLCGATSDPRPEFDHPQHNEPNPILAAYRAHLAKHRLTEDADAWLFALATLEAFGGFATWEATTDRYYSLTTATEAQADHARRVLTRLARFTEQETPA